MAKTLGTGAAILNLRFQIGSARTITFDFGTDLSGWTFEFYLKQNKGARLKDLSLTLGSGISLPIYGTDAIDVSFTSSNTSITEGEYYWELRRTDLNVPLINGLAYFSYDAPGGDESVPLEFTIGSQTISVTVSTGGGSGSGGGTWGSITGTLSDQADLQSALNLKAPIASPVFTGTPLAPTASPGTSTTQLATTAFVAAAVTGGSVADGDKGDIVVTGSGSIWTIDGSVALSGNPTTTTQSAGNNSTRIATTAYADAKVADAINDGTTGVAPSQNAVFDALALKQNNYSGFYVVSTIAALQTYLSGLGNVDVNIWFPAGTYNVSSAITISTKQNIRIFGEGAKLQLTGASSFNMIDMSGVSNVDIKGLTIDFGTLSNSVTGISLVTINGVTKISHMKFVNYGTFNQTGITGTNMPRIIGSDHAYPGTVISDCDFGNVTITGASIDYNANVFRGRGIYFAASAEYWTVANCKFNAMQIGIYADNGANGIVTGCSFTTMCPRQGSTEYGAITLWENASNTGKTQIIGNNFNHNYGPCIYSTVTVGVRPSIINGNNFIGNAVNPIKITSTQDRNIITNNYFNTSDYATSVNVTNNPYTTADYSFISTASSYNIISNNQFVNNVTSPQPLIKTTGTSDFNDIKNNKYDAGTLTSLANTGDIVQANEKKLTLQPDATNAGLNIGTIAGNPSSQVNGDIWINSVNGHTYSRVGGVDYQLDGTGGTGYRGLGGTYTFTAQVTDVGSSSNLYVKQFNGILNNRIDGAGIHLQNSTASLGNTSAQQEWSPSITFEGQSWKTVATAGSQPVKFNMGLQTTVGTTTGTGNFVLASNVNGAGYTNLLSVTPGVGAIFTFGTNITANIGNGNVNALSLTGTTSTVTNNGIHAVTTNGFSLVNSANAGSTFTSEWSPRLRFQGSGWSAAATPQDAQFITELQPVPGTTPIKANLVTSSSIAGGAFGAVSTLTSDGSLSLGMTTAPTARLHIGAGTATANTAPLQFTSGTVETTARAGIMEYDGTNLLFTRTGTTRGTLIQSDAVNSVTPTLQNRTITVNIGGTLYYITAKTTND